MIELSLKLYCGGVRTAHKNPSWTDRYVNRWSGSNRDEGIEQKTRRCKGERIKEKDWFYCCQSLKNVFQLSHVSSKTWWLKCVLFEQGKDVSLMEWTFNAFRHITIFTRGVKLSLGKSWSATTSLLSVDTSTCFSPAQRLRQVLWFSYFCAMFVIQRIKSMMVTKLDSKLFLVYLHNADA